MDILIVRVAQTKTSSPRGLLSIPPPKRPQHRPSRLPILRCGTDLVPEWPLQVLGHVPADLSKEVVRALMKLNQTHEAAVAGAYSTWDAPLSYSYLR